MKVTVQIGAQLVWGVLDTTAGVIKLVGEGISVIPIIGPPIGNFFIAVADATHNVAYAVAQNFKVGPYLFSG